MQYDANQVICGNIGTVYSGNDETEAKKIFDAYVELSKLSFGLSSGAEPYEEYFGTNPRFFGVW